MNYPTGWWREAERGSRRVYKIDSNHNVSVFDRHDGERYEIDSLKKGAHSLGFRLRVKSTGAENLNNIIFEPGGESCDITYTENWKIRGHTALKSFQGLWREADGEGASEILIVRSGRSYLVYVIDTISGEVFEGREIACSQGGISFEVIDSSGICIARSRLYCRSHGSAKMDITIRRKLIRLNRPWRCSNKRRVERR